MEEVAQGVWRYALTPREGVNVYVVGDVLVDAGTAGMGKKLPERLKGRPIAAHTITHAHPDHVGGSRAVVDALGVPFWAPEGDAAAVEAGESVGARSRIEPLLRPGRKFPPVPVARRLREGDDVAGFTVLDTPGHSPGHISLWRESDRVLICGDVWFNLSIKTFRYGLRQPPKAFTVDPERNRESERRLAALQPEVVCFGHGPVVRDAAPMLQAFVASL